MVQSEEQKQIATNIAELMRLVIFMRLSSMLVSQTGSKKYNFRTSLYNLFLLFRYVYIVPVQDISKQQ